MCFESGGFIFRETAVPSTGLFSVALSALCRATDSPYRGFAIIDTPQSVGLLCTSDQPARPLRDNTYNTSQQTDVHAPGGIRTHNLNRRTAADLRP